MSREKIKELGDAICEYCPFISREVSHSIGRPCEGDYCEEAYRIYCAEQEAEERHTKELQELRERYEADLIAFQQQMKEVSDEMVQELKDKTLEAHRALCPLSCNGDCVDCNYMVNFTQKLND